MSITFDTSRASAYVSAALPANLSTDSLYPAAKTLGSYWLNGMNLLGQTTSDVLANLGSLSYKSAEMSFDAAKKLYEIGQIYLQEHPETAQSLANWRNIGVASAIALPTLSKLAHIQMDFLVHNGIQTAKNAYSSKKPFSQFKCEQNPLLPCSYQMVAYLLAAKELARVANNEGELKTIVDNVLLTYMAEKNYFGIPYSIAPHSYFRWLYYEGPYIDSLRTISASSDDIGTLRPRAVEAIDWLSKYWAPSIPSYFFKRLGRIGGAFIGG